MRWCTVLLGVFACGCVALTPEGARVSVYSAPLNGLPHNRSMPDGCRLLATKPPISMPELDLEGQKDPFRVERNDAGAAGANALLVLSQMTVGRRNMDCAGGSRITDCPGDFGAWFLVAVETYTCAPEALRTLATVPPKAFSSP
jgi:hypothetical protein